MICNQCRDEGKRSKVYPGVSTRTLMWAQPYYDEVGRYHHNDPNTTTTEYTCSNRHRWVTRAGPDGMTTKSLEPLEPKQDMVGFGLQVLSQAKDNQVMSLTDNGPAFRDLTQAEEEIETETSNGVERRYGGRNEPPYRRRDQGPERGAPCRPRGHAAPHGGSDASPCGDGKPSDDSMRVG